MVKSKSLLKGIGDYNTTRQYYDEWSTKYDSTLKNWNYKAPKKSSLILKKYLHYNPKYILDLACGIGLFAEEIKKIYPLVQIQGMDISKEILKKARIKNIYNKLICSNFDKPLKVDKKFDLISCIGAMTYTKNPKELLLKISKIMKSNGYLIFTHRLDIWKKQNFSKILDHFSNIFKVIYISRPILYLPKNKDFTDKIKIKISLLKKY